MGAGNYIVKASPNRFVKVKTLAAAVLVTAAAAVGIWFAVLNAAAGKYLFTALYAAASALGVIYTIMAVNSVFMTYIAIDGSRLYIKNWTNGFVPFKLHSNAGFIREFMPAKTTLISVRHKDVARCLMGSGRYLRKHCADNYDFMEKLDSFEKKHGGGTAYMEMFYIETVNGNSCFVPVTNFDEESLAKIFNLLEKSARIRVMCNNYSVAKKKKSIAPVK